MNDKEPPLQKIAEETGRDVEQGVTGVAPPDGHNSHEHKRRTWGNKIFDLAVWPTIAFGAVFAFSVWATHKAMFGKGMAKEKFDALANAIKKTPLVNKSLPEATQNELAAGHALVGVSFLAGTALMAPIKLLEDRRGKISQWIDAKLGTTHDDPQHYAKEPKQSWKSVLGGRAVTFASVLAISKVAGDHIINAAHAVADKTAGLPEAVAKTGAARELAGKRWQIHFVSAFEGFYTALCAVSVYVLSRLFARRLNESEEKHASAAHPPAPRAAAPVEEAEPAKTLSWQDKAPTRNPPQKAEGFVSTVDSGRMAQAQQPALG